MATPTEILKQVWLDEALVVFVKANRENLALHFEALFTMISHVARERADTDPACIKSAAELLKCVEEGRADALKRQAAPPG